MLNARVVGVEESTLGDRLGSGGRVLEEDGWRVGEADRNHRGSNRQVLLVQEPLELGHVVRVVGGLTEHRVNWKPSESVLNHHRVLGLDRLLSAEASDLNPRYRASLLVAGSSGCSSISSGNSSSSLSLCLNASSCLDSSSGSRSMCEASSLSMSSDSISESASSLDSSPRSSISSSSSSSCIHLAWYSEIPFGSRFSVSPSSSSSSISQSSSSLIMSTSSKASPSCNGSRDSRSDPAPNTSGSFEIRSMRETAKSPRSGICTNLSG
ncbi:hypothetical protein OGAPHI_000832 [Ogataea philodendri]|uniref:Uncharacterized protein n=1 Tax=Ogataea philodendri TaxID=1378263 RepID=A0A9P8TAI2_9ASCO|nr:uncharacterized protein OGAPHI_000832 [Ogataea philodendri]KAH3671121.1 hypothetical protein OGAPHI_000832 [Ogataea philodendri]